jgi:hypothetical protein
MQPEDYDIERDWDGHSGRIRSRHGEYQDGLEGGGVTVT